VPNIEELKRLLREGGFTCVLSDGSELFTSRERGVKPLVGFLDSGKNFHGCFAADKIVGRAAAFLYVRLGVCALHASVMTAGAAEICRKYKIAASSDMTTDNIINRKGDGILIVKLRGSRFALGGQITKHIAVRELGEAL